MHRNSVKSIVLGATSESIKYAMSNNSHVIYRNVDYPVQFNIDDIDIMETSMMLLSLVGNLHEVERPTVTLDMVNSRIKYENIGQEIEFEYEELKIYDDSMIRELAGKTYSDESFEYRITYEFLVNIGRFHLAGKDFDFDDFGFDSMDIGKSVKGRSSNTLSRNCVVETERCSIEDLCVTHGFRINCIDSPPLTVYNDGWEDLIEWEETRFDSLGDDWESIRALQRYSDTFTNIFTVIQADEYDESWIEKFEVLLCECIVAKTLTKEVELTELRVEKIRLNKVYDSLREEVESYDNVEVL